MRKSLLILGFLASLTAASDLKAAEGPSSSPTATARLDAAIEPYVTANQFMGSVLVVRDGQVLLDKGYGVADVEAKTPITPTTRFYIGSITKQFTAALILRLEERGKLSTTDPIGAYVPDLPAAWRPIRLQDLLSHTSGIPEFTSLPLVFAAATRPTKPDRIIDFIRDRPLEFPVGSRYGYSNSNYVLLGMVLERVSGKAYADLIQDEIFTPLQMLSTRFDDQPGNTKGYTYSPTGMHTPQAFDISWAYAAGGISSTTSDLFRWQQALFGGKVLSPASLAKMMTPHKDGYGFGLVIHTDRDNPFIDHSGQLPGFNSTMAWYPDRRVSVIILENVEPSPPAPSASDVRATLDRTLRDQTAGSVPRPTAGRERSN